MWVSFKHENKTNITLTRLCNILSLSWLSKLQIAVENYAQKYIAVNEYQCFKAEIRQYIKYPFSYIKVGFDGILIS